jgi:hypothetical protein
MTDRISEIRARLEKATSGPWKVVDDPSSMMWDVAVTNHNPGEDDFRGIIASLSQTNQIPADEQEANGTLLANAPADIAYLLDRVEALEAALRGVVNVANRNTPEFDAARRALTTEAKP